MVGDVEHIHLQLVHPARLFGLPARRFLAGASRVSVSILKRPKMSKKKKKKRKEKERISSSCR